MTNWPVDWSGWTGDGARVTAQRPAGPSAATLRAAHAKGGYAWTRAVSQRAGSAIAAQAMVRGWTPSHLSLGNLVIGCFTSLGFLLLHGRAPVLAACLGVMGWQLAYALDCGDGQLARATGRASPAGAILDIVCDFFVGATVAAAFASVAGAAGMPTGLAAVSGALWLTGTAYHGLETALDVRMASLGGSAGRLLAQVRDYGLQVAVMPVLAAFSDTATYLGLVSITALSAGFLARKLFVLARTRPMTD